MVLPGQGLQRVSLPFLEVSAQELSAAGALEFSPFEVGESRKELPSALRSSVWVAAEISSMAIQVDLREIIILFFHPYKQMI